MYFKEYVITFLPLDFLSQFFLIHNKNFTTVIRKFFNRVLKSGRYDSMNQEKKNKNIKEEARLLRKKLKRTEGSRSSTKAKSREKSKTIKAHQDRQKELEENRDTWKKKCKEQGKENDKLRDDIKQLASQLQMSVEDLEKIRSEFNELKKKSHPGFGTRKHTK